MAFKKQLRIALSDSVSKLQILKTALYSFAAYNVTCSIHDPTPKGEYPPNLTMAPSAIPMEPVESFEPDKVKAKTPHQTVPTINPDYRIAEEPIGTRRPLRVVCMGAGYSGLMMAIVFNERMRDSNATLQIFERNEDIGGTWLENRYPGCRCDIPAYVFPPTHHKSHPTIVTKTYATGITTPTASAPIRNGQVTTQRLGRSLIT